MKQQQQQQEQQKMTVTQLFEALKEVRASVSDLVWVPQEDQVTQFIRKHDMSEIELRRMFPEFESEVCGKFTPAEVAEHIYDWLIEGEYRGFLATIEVDHTTKVSYIVYGKTMEQALEHGLTWAKDTLEKLGVGPNWPKQCDRDVDQIPCSH